MLGALWLGFAGCSGSTDVGTVASTTTLPVLLDLTDLPANEPHTWPLRVHCGADVFSVQVNGTWWRTAEAPSYDRIWLPKEWGNDETVEQLDVVVEINAAGDRLEATYAGRSVVYTPTELTETDLCD